jgi:hypothetical protein
MGLELIDAVVCHVRWEIVSEFAHPVVGRPSPINTQHALDGVHMPIYLVLAYTRDTRIRGFEG